MWIHSYRPLRDHCELSKLGGARGSHLSPLPPEARSCASRAAPRGTSRRGPKPGPAARSCRAQPLLAPPRGPLSATCVCPHASFRRASAGFRAASRRGSAPPSPSAESPAIGVRLALWRRLWSPRSRSPPAPSALRTGARRRSDARARTPHRRGQALTRARQRQHTHPCPIVAACAGRRRRRGQDDVCQAPLDRRVREEVCR